MDNRLVAFLTLIFIMPKPNTRKKLIVVDYGFWRLLCAGITTRFNIHSSPYILDSVESS
jgi:hypothetical protein